MLRRKLLKQFTWCKFRRRSLSTENHVKHSEKNEVDLSRVRNIGILAHIDAGKTTTTERMLFYSGTIGNMGEVHHGNTVTDYMDQERQRGITITSAAVTFGWKNHRFNLIDTPGHIDFTMEVEQTLNVMDGAVVVLDGSAGVEAQTLTVWRQADRYALPRIIYVNKMDRLDANFNYCISSVESKLETTALPAQIPIQDSSGLTGIVDVLTMQLLTFEKKNEGKKYQRVELTEEKDGSIWERAMEARSKLTDKLSGVDDRLAELVIEQESLDKIPAQILVESMRRCTIAGKGVPLLLGSSYKNAGVQPLMDGVILYLPSPESNSSAKQFHCFGDNLAARAFKVVHDKHKGALTFLRIYSGTFKQGQRVFNVQKENTEQCGKLFEAYADEYSEVAAIERGNIAAVSGLKLTTSGDLLTTSATAASQAKRAMQKQNNTTNEDVESLFGTGARVPNPVFFCSIEPPSISYQVPLDTALEQLQREDPSLRVTQDAETGQTVLSGMGELHLEIIAERIRSEFKIDVDLGPLQIAYKETLQTAVKDTHVTSHRIGSTTHSVQTTMSIEPNYKGEDVLRLDRTPDSVAHTNAISPRILQLAKKGVNAALNNGPKLGCPVINVGVTLHWLEIGKGTSTTMISATITQCLHKLLRTGGTMLLEPIMQLEVVTSEETVSLVISDLSRRRAQIQQIGSRGRSKIVYALTPLSELLGYSKSLRTLTSGAGSFSIEFNHYQEMGALEERQAIERVTGFAH
ncbi:ribosome-releasing factor 2, mitochondrial [Neodiprion pinetum]|uniref:Ribosome-releasing factor 2, mitochondrial n=1 Tax=Neodiprion lecontei TaxID=441921 RepID=A0A6J0BHJ7_NEOLC|nr:ribosome-releasing factor 2, mitochondrial [Neodiprion lecontei]XP_046492284.1 ribosome-releasing factor 2, mitochondrial [Neodiprion pinetum]